MVVQTLSCVPVFETPRTAAHQASLSFSISGICLNSCPLSWWCHLSSDLIFHCPFSCCPQSFPSSGSFPISRLFASGGQSTGASASASVLPVNIQGWFPLGLMFWSPCYPIRSKSPLLVRSYAGCFDGLSLMTVLQGGYYYFHTCFTAEGTKTQMLNNCWSYNLWDGWRDVRVWP